MGLLPSLIILSVLALIAIGLTKTRPSFPERSQERNSAAAVLAIATILQFIHFGEELATGFRTEFPELFGLPPIPLLLFVSFNLGCLLLWTYAVLAISFADKIALGAAWFLALAGILNGIAHPLLSLATGAYFPGLYSSLPVAVACCWLLVNLIRATKPFLQEPALQ